MPGSTKIAIRNMNAGFGTTQAPAGTVLSMRKYRVSAHSTVHNAGVMT